MFYTKYRPQKFSEIVLNNEASKALAKQISEEKTVHAYLFIGPRGTGKTSTARILAKSLNCLNLEKNGDPCDKCDNCKAIKLGSFIDLIEIDAASNRGIDDIRELKDKINLAPSSGRNKVYIIDEVHMLTPPAFNALLKTLEEPPSNTTFILCTTELHKVPDTIKSRCQVFRFKRASVSQIIEKLEKITKEEKAKIKKEDLEKIALASMGGFRDAETILQQVIEGDISVDLLTSFSSKEKFIDFTNYLLNCDSKSALILINNIYEEGIDLYIWVGEYLKYLRDLLFIKAGLLELDVSSDLLTSMKEQAKVTDLEWLSTALSKLVEQHIQIKKSVIPQLPIEIFIVELCGNNNTVSKKNSVNVDKKEQRSIKKDSNSNTKEDTKKTLHASVEKNENGDEDEDKEGEDGGNEDTDYVNDTNEDDDLEEIGIPVTDLPIIEGKWSSVLEKMKEVNGPVLAILRSAKPLRVEGKFIILEVYYPFHKERLESLGNREKLEGVLNEIYGLDISIKCDLSKEKPKNLKKRETGILTDVNVAPVSASEIMNVFDGGLPL